MRCLQVHGKKAVTNFGQNGEFVPHKRGGSVASEASGAPRPGLPALHLKCSAHLHPAPRHTLR